MNYGITGVSLLTLDIKDFKHIGFIGDDKTRFKRKLKDLKIQVDKEKRRAEKERKEKERLWKKAEKASKHK